MRNLNLFIPGEPQGKAHLVPMMVRGHARAIAKQRPPQKAWTTLLVDCFSAAVERQDWELCERGGIGLALVFVLPRPKRFCWKGHHAEPRHTCKPDAENLLNVVQNAGNGILWRDDAQVCNITELRKRYAHIGERCGLELTVTALGEWEGVQ